MTTFSFQPPTPTISNAQFTADGSILCEFGDMQVCIPIDENNTDYQAVMAWVAAGNQIIDLEAL